MTASRDLAQSTASTVLVCLSVLALCGTGAPATAQNCGPAERDSYRGRLFDAMAQIGEHRDGETYLATAQALGVTRIGLFERAQQGYRAMDLVDRLAAAHPGFIVMGSPKVFYMRGDLDPPYVDHVLEGVSQGHYRFVGEILYSHGDKENGEITATGERYIDPIGPQTERLIAGLAGRNVPILTHWEVYEWDRDWPKFHRLYAAHPGQIFGLAACRLRHPPTDRYSAGRPSQRLGDLVQEGKRRSEPGGPN